MQSKEPKNREILVLNFFTAKRIAFRFIFFALSLAFIGASIYIFLFGDETLKDFLAPGIAMSVLSLGVFIFLLFKVFDKHLSFEEYKDLMEKDFYTAYNDSLRSLAIEKEDLCYTTPFVCFFPAVYPFCNKVDYKVNKKNGDIFHSHSKTSSVMFDKENVYFYNSHINHILGVNSFENATECRYNDIRSITTSTDVIKTGTIYHDMLKVNFTITDGSVTELVLRDRLSYSRRFNAPLLKTVKSRLILLLLLVLQLVVSALAFFIPYHVLWLDWPICTGFMVASLIPAIILLCTKKSISVMPSASKISPEEHEMIFLIRSIIRDNSKK